MAESNFSNIWNMLSEDKFKVDPDSTNEDLLCIICNKLIIDACQSVCGCQYCYKCITEYLRDGDKNCPGDSAECKNGSLNVDRNIIRNMRTNRRMAQLKVLCPNESCQSKMELIEMCEHLRLCIRQSFECPYLSIGCDNKEEPEDSIMTHLSNNALTHIQLLIECVRNLKNEVGELRNNFEKCKSEVQMLREELRMKDVQTNEIMDQISKHSGEIRTFKEESIHKENIIVTLTEEVYQLKTEVLIGLDDMNEETITKEEDCGRAFKKPANLRNKLWQKVEKIDSQLCQMKNDISEMLIMSQKFNNDTGRRMKNMIQWNKLCPNIDADYVWKINEFINKIDTMSETPIFSESFYAHNYRFCIRLYISGDNLGLRCYIMRGGDDEKLDWPMKGTVTLSIIDHESLKSLKSITCNYNTNDDKSAFDRPKNVMNDYGFGVYPFITFSSIESLRSIVVNDSLVVSFDLSFT